MPKISRRDFLKLGSSAFAGLGILPLMPGFKSFDDSQQVRVTTKAISVHSGASDQNRITGQHFRDELVNIYEEVDAGDPAYNPIWYRVWGGYMHRARLQMVKTLFNEPLASIPEGTRQMAELTVPYTQAMRYTKVYGGQPNLRLYYGSVHWISGMDEGPDGTAWYRIFDELVGFPYHVPAIHLRPISLEEWSPINTEVPPENKRIEVNLAMQVLTAYENETVMLKTKISSGITTARRDPKALSTQTPSGEFHILSKYPSKHMAMETFLPLPKIMNYQAYRGLVFFMRQVMLSMEHTGMITSALL